MSFIEFKSIDAETLAEDSIGSNEQAEEEKQRRLTSFNRAVDAANLIIKNNPEVLCYYWNLWSFRNCPDAELFAIQKITRESIRRMRLPNEEEQHILKQHLQQFTVRLQNELIQVEGSNLYAHTKSSAMSSVISVSIHTFDIVDDNLRTIFLSQVILHELAHVFEPIHVDLELMGTFYCDVFSTRTSSPPTAKITKEVGDIFETMYFGGIVQRFDQNEIRWIGDPTDSETFFSIHDDRHYNLYLRTFDLSIIRNILKKKRRSTVIHHFFQSVRHRLSNVFGLFNRQTI